VSQNQNKNQNKNKNKNLSPTGTEDKTHVQFIGGELEFLPSLSVLGASEVFNVSMRHLGNLGRGNLKFELFSFSH
jgi:hypothetical protein